MTTDLAKNSEGYLNFGEETLKLIESRDFGNLSVTPRKSLESSFLLFHCGRDSGDGSITCYFPHEYTFGCLGQLYCPVGPLVYGLNSWQSKLVPCRSKLYGILETSRPNLEGSEPLSLERQLVSYSPYSDSWVVILPCEEDRYLQQIFVKQEDEIHALVSEYCKYHGLCRNPSQQYLQSPVTR